MESMREPLYWALQAEREAQAEACAAAVDEAAARRREFVMGYISAPPTTRPGVAHTAAPFFVWRFLSRALVAAGEGLEIPASWAIARWLRPDVDEFPLSSSPMVGQLAWAAAFMEDPAFEYSPASVRAAIDGWASVPLARTLTLPWLELLTVLGYVPTAWEMEQCGSLERGRVS